MSATLIQTAEITYQYKSDSLSNFQRCIVSVQLNANRFVFLQ